MLSLEHSQYHDPLVLRQLTSHPCLDDTSQLQLSVPLTIHLHIIQWDNILNASNYKKLFLRHIYLLNSVTVLKCDLANEKSMYFLSLSTLEGTLSL